MNHLCSQNGTIILITLYFRLEDTLLCYGSTWPTSILWKASHLCAIGLTKRDGTHLQEDLLWLFLALKAKSCIYATKVVSCNNEKWAQVQQWRSGITSCERLERQESPIKQRNRCWDDELGGDEAVTNDANNKQKSDFVQGCCRTDQQWKKCHHLHHMISGTSLSPPTLQHHRTTYLTAHGTQDVA